MKTDEYLLLLGKIIANLNSLEFAARAVLAKYNENKEPQFDHATIIPGAHVPENSYTNYDSLGQVITKFNSIVDPKYCLDSAIVELRDMIAHGRIASKSPTLFPMELIKYGRSDSKGIPVETVATMNRDWLILKVKLVHDQIIKVVKASKDLGQGIF